MSGPAKLVLFLVLSIVPVARATDEATLRSTAQKVAAQIAKNPSNPAGLYAPSFLDAVPQDKLAGLYQSLFAQHGAVLHVMPLAGSSAIAGKFTFSFKDVEIPVTLSIEANPPHRVDGLWFGPPVPRLKSLQQVADELAKLPGKVSYQLQSLDDGKVLASHDPDKALAIGSAFKLYVLATLIHEKIPWDKVVRIEDRYKSLPSGDMQDWPTGSPVTVDTLALQMISKSDNTAADHLLALAGRANVEAMLPRLGLKKPEADVPFLSTLQLFRLKSDPALRARFLAADQPGRASIFAGIADAPPPDVGQLASQGPTAIDTVEWFASAADLCRLLQWCDKHADTTALSILAVNPGEGAITASDAFTYVGFKGGSEPGVLSMNWLLRTRDGRHYALSVTWNDPTKDVDLAKLSGLTAATTDLIGGK